MKNIFLAPRSNETAYEHFESTIKGGRAYDFFEPYLTDNEKAILSEYKTIKVWGTKESLRGRWEQMKSGDYVLFYAGKKFYYSARIILTKYDQYLGEKLWPLDKDGQPWSCLFFVDQLRDVNIPIKAVQQLAEYEETWDRVMGFMRLRDSGIEAIVRKFGSVETFLNQDAESLAVISNIIEDVKDEQLEADDEDANLDQILKEAAEFRSNEQGYELVDGVTKRRVESKKQKERVAKIENYQCQLCGWKLEWTNKKTGKKRYRIDIDHIIEKSQGGGEELNNLWALCPNCHAKKTMGVIRVDLKNKKVFENDQEIEVKFDNHLFI